MKYVIVEETFETLMEVPDNVALEDAREWIEDNESSKDLYYARLEDACTTPTKSECYDTDYNGWHYTKKEL